MTHSLKQFARTTIKHVEHINPVFHILFGIVLIAILGTLDFITGNELSFSLFYLLPICWVTWFSYPKSGFFLAILSAIVWLTVEKNSTPIYHHPGIYYWNTGIRLGFFLIVTLLLSSLKQTLENEQRLARIDPLTGAANKRYFIDLLALEIAQCNRYKHPLSIAYIDLDNFKKVNDDFGHSEGDKLLCLIIERITQNIRKIDLVARLGGDEFAILLPETDSETARKVLSRLQQSLLVEMQANHWPVTLSIGVLTCLEVTIDVDEIIRLADGLMYEVKNQGKNSMAYAIR